MTGLFSSPYDIVAPGARVRRMAKARVAYWRAKLKRWLMVKPRSRPVRFARSPQNHSPNHVADGVARLARY